jgi:hypothetical protein
MLAARVGTVGDGEDTFSEKSLPSTWKTLACNNLNMYTEEHFQICILLLHISLLIASS